MSQAKAILRLLDEAGERGVTNFTLNPVAYRYAARIHELRLAGYNIKTLTGKKPSERIFVLVKEPTQQEMFA